MAAPWKTVPPAEQAAEDGAWVGVVSDTDAFWGNGYASLVYPPGIGVGLDPSLIRTWWPGYVSQTIVSGLAPLGTRHFNEPLLFFCWTRRSQGAWSQRYIHLHLVLFDRYRDPQSSHKLADVRIGGRVNPSSDWQLVSSMDDPESLSVPYVAKGREKTEFIGSDGLIRLPPDVEQLEMILEIDNRFESPPTVADVDAIYLGPYQPLILLHPEIPSDTLELAWFFDHYAYPGTTIHMSLDVDLIPNNGNERLMTPSVGLSAICEEPFRISVDEIPKEMWNHQSIFAYAEATRGGITLAMDYAGPLRLNRTDSTNPVQSWSRY